MPEVTNLLQNIFIRTIVFIKIQIPLTEIEYEVLSVGTD
jgi:hypothetical protein